MHGKHVCDQVQVGISQTRKGRDGSAATNSNQVGFIHLRILILMVWRKILAFLFRVNDLDGPLIDTKHESSQHQAQSV